MARTVGIDLGGTKLLALALDDDGLVTGERLVRSPEGADAVIDAFVSVVNAQRADGHIDAVGVGAAGLVDRDGVLYMAPNLPGLRHVPIKALLQERLQLPVQVDNDATCAAWGERELGAAKGSDDVVIVTLGTGIGGGLVYDGHLYRGANGFAGEVGHVKVDPDTIVVGGGLLVAADLFLDRARELFTDLVLAGDVRPGVAIVPAVLGEKAGAIGAALVARDLLSK